MRKYFYDVVVRRYKKDLRNAFSHFSDLFIFHMIFLFIRQNFPVYPTEFPCFPTLRESAVPLPHADIC